MVRLTFIYPGFSQVRTRVEMTREEFGAIIANHPEISWVRFNNTDGSWEYVDIRKPLAIKVEDEQHI